MHIPASSMKPVCILCRVHGTWEDGADYMLWGLMLRPKPNEPTSVLKRKTAGSFAKLQWHSRWVKKWFGTHCNNVWYSFIIFTVHAFVLSLKLYNVGMDIPFMDALGRGSLSELLSLVKTYSHTERGPANWSKKHPQRSKQQLNPRPSLSFTGLPPPIVPAKLSFSCFVSLIVLCFVGLIFCVLIVRFFLILFVWFISFSFPWSTLPTAQTRSPPRSSPSLSNCFFLSFGWCFVIAVLI